MRSKIPGDLVAAVIIPIGHRMHCFSWIRHRNVYKVTRNSSGLYTYSGFSRDSLGKKWHLSKSEMLQRRHHSTLENMCILAAMMRKSVLES